MQETGFSRLYSASNVLLDNDKFWLALNETGQGFTIKVDNCERMVAGCQIKNMGMGAIYNRASKDFRVKGSIHENGTWQTELQKAI